MLPEVSHSFIMSSLGMVCEQSVRHPVDHAHKMAGRDCDQVWNQLQSQSRSRLENAVNGGFSSVSLNSAMRPNEHPLSDSSPNAPPFRLPTSGSSHMAHYSLPATSSSSASSSYHLQHAPSFRQDTRLGDEFGFMEPLDGGRAWFKRKRSSMPVVHDSRNTAGYFNAGSLHGHLQHKSMPDSLHHPCPPIHYDSVILNSEGINVSSHGLLRNVRSRHSSGINVGAGPSRTHSSMNLPNNLDLMSGLPGPSTATQWNPNHASVTFHDAAPFADPRSSASEIRLPLCGSSSRNVVHVGHRPHHNPIDHRSFSSPYMFHGPAHGMGESSPNGQGTPLPWRQVPGHLPSEIIPTSSGGGSHLVSEDLCRHSTPISISEAPHSRGRSGRIRDSSRRFQPLTISATTHGRWIPQGFTGMDRRIVYDPSISLDQHQDMRLDIDNMSYEELLALGESIGSVNTGLSGDKILTCLTRSIHRSFSGEVHNGQDEENCSICLESYEMGEELGSLRCGHGYHFRCVKKWLEIKNSCPICKASALEG